MDAKTKRAARAHRHARVRRKVSGSPERPRLAVYRSNRHIYAQLIDDASARTLVAASDHDVTVKDDVTVKGDKTVKGGKKETAKAVGTLLAERARSAGIERAVFDRGGRLYHGRVAALADAAREGGLHI